VNAARTLILSLACVFSMSCVDWDCVYMKDCTAPGWREADKQAAADWKALQAGGQLCQGLFVNVHTLQEPGLKPPSIHHFPLARISHPTAQDREQAKGVIDATIALMPICGAEESASALEKGSQTHSLPSAETCASCIDRAFRAALRQMQFDPASLNGQPVATRIEVRYRFAACDGDDLCAQVDVDPPSILAQVDGSPRQ
jgi:hypothetical protein